MNPKVIRAYREREFVIDRKVGGEGLYMSTHLYDEAR